MIIATRVLFIRRKSSVVEVPVQIFAPREEDGSWMCRFDVGWPEGTWSMSAGGVDGVQALELALRIVGAQLYGSDHHASGALMWLEPGQGYGFPVPATIRDMLIGDDRVHL